MWIESAVVAGLGAAGAVAAYSWYFEPNRFVQRKYHVQVPASVRKDLRILHLSDFHFFAGMETRKHFLHTLAPEPADLIFMTGDFIDYDSGIDLCLQALEPFTARFGKFAVLGNHDFFWLAPKNMLHATGRIPLEKRNPNDVDRLVSGLEAQGIHVLRNRRMEINADGLALTLAGVDDPYLELDDIPATFAGYEKQHPCLMLAHAPERYQELAAHKVDMVFSGHTHGGQIRIPGVGALITRTEAPRSFADGFTPYENTLFYTTRGLGSSKITRPRLFCSPEVSWFTLSFTPDVQVTTRVS